jgi:predicted nuclease with TOPRIM domain
MRWGYPAAFGYPPFQPSMRPEDELEMLEEMRRDLEAELEDIKKRIEELRREIGR